MKSIHLLFVCLLINQYSFSSDDQGVSISKQEYEVLRRRADGHDHTMKSLLAIIGCGTIIMVACRATIGPNEPRFLDHYLKAYNEGLSACLPYQDINPKEPSFESFGKQAGNNAACLKELEAEKKQKNDQKNQRKDKKLGKMAHGKAFKKQPYNRSREKNGKR